MSIHNKAMLIIFIIALFAFILDYFFFSKFRLIRRVCKETTSAYERYRLLYDITKETKYLTASDNQIKDCWNSKTETMRCIVNPKKEIITTHAFRNMNILVDTSWFTYGKGQITEFEDNYRNILRPLQELVNSGKLYVYVNKAQFEKDIERNFFGSAELLIISTKPLTKRALFWASGLVEGEWVEPFAGEYANRLSNVKTKIDSEKLVLENQESITESLRIKELEQRRLFDSFKQSIKLHIQDFLNGRFFTDEFKQNTLEVFNTSLEKKRECFVVSSINQPNLEAYFKQNTLTMEDVESICGSFINNFMSDRLPSVPSR